MRVDQVVVVVADKVGLLLKVLYSTVCLKEC
jgi:hypothetical protein